MAVIQKIRRVANPGGRSGTRRRFASRLRKLGITRNKLGHFVKRKRASRRKHNPVKRHHTAARRRSTSGTKRYSKRRVKRNPLLVELGMVNPRRRRVSVANRKYRRTKANPRRRRAVARVSRRRTYRRRRVAANPAPVRRYRRRRRVVNAAPVRRRRRYTRRHVVHHRRRRNGRRSFARRMNPFGTSTKDMVTMGAGILVGVAAAKYLPSMIPANMLPTSGSPWTGILITGAAAFAAGYVAHRFAGGSFANGIMAGGVALTLSQVLNAIAPPSLSRSLALSGMGDIVPGYFVVPQNPVTSRMPVPIAPPSGNSGVGAVGAFHGAFGGRR